MLIPQAIVQTSGGGGLFDAYALVQDQKVDGTDAGTFTGGAWRTRTLNTEVFDSDGIVSLASDQITLAAGTYYLIGRAPGYQVEVHQTRFQDITNTATLGVGTSAVAWEGSSPAGTVSEVRARVVLAGSTAIELQHWGQRTQANTGFGIASSATSVVEVYAEVEIYREA